MKSVFLFFILIGFYSCRCECNCTKSIIIKKTEIRIKLNDSLIDSIYYKGYIDNKLLYNYYSNQQLLKEKYSKDTNKFKVLEFEYEFKLDSASGLDCGETDRYERDSFFCYCPPF